MEDRRRILLSFEGLEIGYKSPGPGRVLLPPLTGYAREGELIAVIGRNGAGKSTLLRTIAGLHPALSGELKVNGKHLKEYTRMQLSEKVGYISTEIVRVGNLKVYDLVSFGRFPYTSWLGQISRPDDEKIRESIEKTGLSNFIDRSVNQLSDGERQRAMIAMVLAQDAGLMVMDEPTAFLDISSKFEILHIMHELTSSRNKTIIFSTHDLGTALSQADKIWLLRDDGMHSGSPEDLMLEGAFNSLFDASKVIFNIEDGSFRIRSNQKGIIRVRASGSQKFWTEKALIRAGFMVSGSEPSPSVEVTDLPFPKWRFVSETGSAEFGSIYELIAWIRETGVIC